MQCNIAGLGHLQNVGAIMENENDLYRYIKLIYQDQEFWAPTV